MVARDHCSQPETTHNLKPLDISNERQMLSMAFLLFVGAKFKLNMSKFS